MATEPCPRPSQHHAESTQGCQQRHRRTVGCSPAPISSGEVVAVKGGHIVTTQALAALADPLPNSEIQIADGLHLVALSPEEYEPVMLFINHSCEPNVGFAGNVVLVAMTTSFRAGNLPPTTRCLTTTTVLTCNCGAASCRGVIGGHDWRRPELQDRYRGYFSWYLQRRRNRQRDRVRHVTSPGSATS